MESHDLERQGKGVVVHKLCSRQPQIRLADRLSKKSTQARLMVLEQRQG